jgi:trimeric autotransporter adhesin
MNVHIGHAVVRRLFAAIALLLLVAHAHALNNWETGKVLHTDNGCDGCHAAKFGASLTDLNNAISGQAAMAGFSVLTNDQRSDIVAYLNNPEFPIASLSPTSHAFGSLSVDLTANRTFRLSNSGDDDLIVSGTSLSDTTNYTISSNGCAGASVAPGGFCDVVVTFRPQSVGSFNNRTLTITHNTFAASSTAFPISGTGLTQFTVSPLTLTYTAPTVLLQTTITDNKGDRLRICRADAATFNFPEDYSLDAPNTLGGDGCFTTTATASVPRSIPLGVRFTAGASGPRNGALTIQRVTAGGAALGSPITVQLVGNPGPVAAVNAASLFDAPGDPGVEVDNNNTIDRSVTLFSQGSVALTFNASTFLISGASASEYTVVPGGCQALGGLAASSGGTPPSCVLTLRFNPSDVGQRPATLTIQIAGVPNNVVSLNGLGFRGPRLAVSRNGVPASTGDAVQFGTQTIGGLYPTIPVTLNNGGTLGDLEVVLPTAGSVAGFTFAAGAGCANLAPAASCTVDLHFDPAAVQAYASPFTIRTRPAGSVAAYNDFVLNLAGTGSASAMPVLSWTDTTGTPITRLDFPDTDAGAPTTRQIRLFNAGPGGVALQLANVVGLDAGNFILDTSACSTGSNLFQNTSCLLSVQFAPGTAGLKTASIQLTANAGTPPSLVVAPLLTTSGTAISSAPPPTLQLSSTALQFGATVVGSSALPLELRLLNTGSTNLNVTAMSVAAPFVVQGKTCAAMPFVLPPGNECTVSVSFSPQAEGNLTGTLSITTNASATPVEVALSGRGEAKPDLSSGGCSIASGDTATDPTLWTLVLLAVLALLYRRHARGRSRHDGQRRP